MSTEPKLYLIVRDALVKAIEEEFPINKQVIANKNSIIIKAAHQLGEHQCHVAKIKIKPDAIEIHTDSPTDANYKISFLDHDYQNKIIKIIRNRYSTLFYGNLSPIVFLHPQIILCNIPPAKVIDLFDIDMPCEHLEHALKLSYGILWCKKCSIWSRGKSCGCFNRDCF